MQVEKIKNKKIKPQSDKSLVELMVKLYCQKNHKSQDGLCGDCLSVLAYTKSKLDICPYGDKKPFCSSCKTNCYEAKERLKIKRIMAYSGPRLIFYRPITLFKYFLSNKNK